MHASTRATITAGASAVVAGSAYFGTQYLALAIFVCIAMASIGWPALLRVSQPLVSTILVFGGGSLALVAVVLGRNEPYLRYMAVAIAGITIGALVAEVFYPSAQGRVITSVSGTAAAGAVAASGAAWVAVDRTPGAEDLVVAGAAALAIAAIASVATSRAGINTLLTLVLGIASGVGTGYLFDSISWFGGGFVGLVAAAAALLVHELARREPPPPTKWAGIASAMTPVLVAGVLVYIVGRLYVG